MSEPPDPALRAVREFVDEVRDHCLWFLREDWYPATIDEARSALDAIQRNADLATYRKAAVLRTWLSPSSHSPSAD